MHIVYGFSGCSEQTYQKLLGGIGSNAAVKYHRLLMEGLAENGISVLGNSGLPVNRSIMKKLWIHPVDDEENGVRYHYFRTVNFPILRHIGLYFGARHAVLRARKKTKEKCYALCDCLNIATAYGMARGARRGKIPLILIVTDLPDMMGGGKLTKKLNNRLFAKADGFIFLTEQMNARVNKKGKPYIVLEGHADSALPELSPDAKYERTSGKQIVIYAGSLKKIYGIENLVTGFLQADIPNAELHIYGNGDFREELETIAKNTETVKYLGLRPNAEIVYEEQRAALLVNPRPTAPEYTKYSFPSKNMEYMASGTPILTTKLPGIPAEYAPYIYMIEEDTAAGVKKALSAVLTLPFATREQKGRAARAFVFENKSNKVQAEKIKSFLEQKIG